MTMKQRMAALARQMPVHAVTEDERLARFAHSLRPGHLDAVWAHIKQEIEDAQELPQPGELGYEDLLRRSAAARMSPLEFRLYGVRDLIEAVAAVEGSGRQA